MANTSIYFEALMTFNAPATAKEVHDKAKEMFADQVAGDKGSCRQSLDRYVARGKVEKPAPGRYLISMAYIDPISTLTTQNRVLQAEVERLRQRIRELESST